MDTILINSKNRGTSGPHRLLLDLTEKINLKRSDKYVALSNLRQKWYLYKNNDFEVSASSWNGEFELPDGSYSVSDIQDYFKYILKKDWQSFNKNIRQ